MSVNKVEKILLIALGVKKHGLPRREDWCNSLL